MACGAPLLPPNTCGPFKDVSSHWRHCMRSLRLPVHIESPNTLPCHSGPNCRSRIRDLNCLVPAIRPSERRARTNFWTGATRARTVSGPRQNSRPTCPSAGASPIWPPSGRAAPVTLPHPMSAGTFLWNSGDPAAHLSLGPALSGPRWRHPELREPDQWRSHSSRTIGSGGSVHGLASDCRRSLVPFFSQGSAHSRPLWRPVRDRASYRP